jgi:alkylation response protein AidB-like acyl-CoA dehydrogenase
VTATLTVAGLDPVLRTIAATAAEIDAGLRPATTHLGALADAGLLDLGIDDLLADAQAATDIRPAADTIAAVAEECLPSAFGFWAHRVVEDYLARGNTSPATAATLARLRRGEAVGATGMAQALKSLAGLGELGIEAAPAGDGWVLTGFVSWISNLVDDAILVLPARTPDDGGIVVWVPLSEPRLSPKRVSGLLALDATASGTLALDGVRIPADQVLSSDLPGFVAAVKPTFLILQTAFAAGVIRRSWREIENALDRSENAVFGALARRLGEDIAEFLTRWQSLAADTASAPVRDVLKLRLDASHLAQQATRLELTLAGGRGYLVASGANRRFREAAFLPVQSPSEGHLTWELSSLA